MDPNVHLMAQLDKEYRNRSGVSHRRQYSIFYSRLCRSPILILGYNPGGDPATWDESALASLTYYEGWEHEYADCHYPLAVAMRSFLLGVFELDIERLRRLPKSNLIFRRSSGSGSLPLPEAALVAEAQPTVDGILELVAPHLVICEGMKTAELFLKHYCSNVSREVDGCSVETPNGRWMARIYERAEARLNRTGTDITVLALGHPSRYQARSEWTHVEAQARRAARELGLDGPSGTANNAFEPTA